jgi:hypothetical protein
MHGADDTVDGDEHYAQAVYGGYGIMRRGKRITRPASVQAGVGGSVYLRDALCQWSSWPESDPAAIS